MNTTIELSMCLVMEINRLNLRFTREMLSRVTPKTYPDFLRCYYCLLSDKWQEYQALN